MNRKLTFLCLSVTLCTGFLPVSGADFNAGFYPSLGQRLGLRQSGAVVRAGSEIQFENLISAPVWRRAGGTVSSPVLLTQGFLPAKYQGPRNTCNVFAATALAEYLMWQKTGALVPLSEEFLFFDAKYYFTDSPERRSYRNSQGLAGYIAVDALRGGIVRAADWPYNPAWKAVKTVPPVSDPEVGVPPEGLKTKIMHPAFTPVAIRRGDIKNFLASEHRPVVMNMMLYSATLDAASGHLGDPTPEVIAACAAGQIQCGGHVILITGYDPSSGMYTFRNSWGERWGRNGYGTFSEKYLMENCEACAYLPQIGGQPPASQKLMINAAYGWSAGIAR